jgi:hypothetical protein
MTTITCAMAGCCYLAVARFDHGVTSLCYGHAKRRMEDDRRRHESVAQRPVLAARGDGR